jgi:hypothetical protein
VAAISDTLPPSTGVAGVLLLSGWMEGPPPSDTRLAWATYLDAHIYVRQCFTSGALPRRQPCAAAIGGSVWLGDLSRDVAIAFRPNTAPRHLDPRSPSSTTRSRRFTPPPGATQLQGPPMTSASPYSRIPVCLPAPGAWVAGRRAKSNPSAIMPAPRAKCSQLSAVSSGTKFASLCGSTISPYSHRTR